MNGELYYIPMIARALEQPDPKSALLETFDRIKNIGQQPGRAESFRQFLRFMDEVIREHSRTGSVEEPSILVDVAAACVKRLTDTVRDPTDTQKPGTSSSFAGQGIYERFCTDVRDATDRPSVREIIVERNGVMLAGFVLEQAPDTHSIHNVTPGHYLLWLESGRVLWECELTDQDLIWSTAFPGSSLPMAADSGDSLSEPTHEVSLMGDRMVLSVHPEVESGSITIIWRGQETRT